MKKRLLFFAWILHSIYALTLFLRVPISALSAEKALAAHQILSGLPAPGACHFGLFEFPLYLLGIGFGGFNAYSVIAVHALLYALLTLLPLIHLSRHPGKQALDTLILFSFACLPTVEALDILQDRADVCLCLLCVLIAVEKGWHPAACIFACLLSRGNPLTGCWLLTALLLYFALNRCEGKLAAVLSVSCVLGIALSPRGFPNFGAPAVLETLNALQKVFNANFSKQPLISFRTPQFFFWSIALLLSYVCAFRSPKHPAALCFLCAPLIALFTQEEQAGALCALPLCAAALLIERLNRADLRNLRIAEERLPFRLPVLFFFTLTALSSLQMPAFARIVSDYDRIAIALTEDGLTAGYCAEKEIAPLSLASKGHLTLTPFPADFRSEKGTFFVLDGSAELPAPDEIRAVGERSIAVYHCH